MEIGIHSRLLRENLETGTTKPEKRVLQRQGLIQGAVNWIDWDYGCGYGYDYGDGGGVGPPSCSMFQGRARHHSKPVRSPGPHTRPRREAPSRRQDARRSRSLRRRQIAPRHRTVART